MPNGFSIQNATGIISGTARELGTFIVKLDASNSTGTCSALLVIRLANNAAPSAPNNVTATAVDTYKARLSWDAVVNAT